jgi:cell division protein FtsB
LFAAVCSTGRRRRKPHRSGGGPGILVHCPAMKWFAAALGLALLLLQYRLWFSEDGVRGVIQMQSSVETQRGQNDRLSERNLQLAAEVRDLKQGYAALEERARSDLGMIAGNETYYQVVPAPTAGHNADGGMGTTPVPATAPLRTAAR